MGKRTSLIPKKIWMLWYQGVSEAPFIVRSCIDSWIKQNPNWEVIILDSECLNQYVRLNLPEKKVTSLSLNHLSDLLRLALLSKYGGVWADATTFCMKPLDDWINDCSTSGFFAFYKPGRDRIMSNWFMVSEKGNPIVLKLKERLTLYWVENKFDIPKNRFQKIAKKKLEKILNKSEKTTRYWFSPIVTKLLKVYPYFVFHYMFEQLVSSDTECQIIWNNTKKVNADGPQRFGKLRFLSPVTDTIKNEINNKHTPIYKLTWKYDNSKYAPNSVLDYLVQGNHKET